MYGWQKTLGFPDQKLCFLQKNSVVIQLLPKKWAEDKINSEYSDNYISKI